MNNLYFLSYNNYFNRIVKKEERIDAYLSYAVGSPMININFNPNDGITTEQIVNADYSFLGTPDYCVVTDTANDIESRWFVIEVSRLRSGQYRVQLKRDSIADTLEDVLNAESFITKGTVEKTSPIVFNDEGTTVNQIKQSELLLKDNTEMPWIVGYISPDVARDHGNITGEIDGFIAGGFEDWGPAVPGYNYYGKNIVKTKDLYVDVCIDVMGHPGNDHIRLWPEDESSGILQKYTPHYKGVKIQAAGYAVQFTNKWNQYASSARSGLINMNLTAGETIVSDFTFAGIQNLEGNIIRVKNKYYHIHLTAHYMDELWPNRRITKDSGDMLYHIFNGNAMNVYPEAFNIGGIYYTLDYIEDSTASESSTKFEYSFSGKNVANETSPYGVLCMPYKDEIGDKLSAKSRLKIMQALGSVSGLLYDIQILPYCPIRTLTINGKTISDSDPNAITIDVKIAQTSDILTKIRISRTPSFSFKIPTQIRVNDVKLANETSFCRLSSPNYSGTFDFTPAKFYQGNPVVINYFSVDCQYKPYTPYIHVAPQWAGLYGKDFKDARGLICSGDFSADRINDQWATYQYDNKNFQLQFDRQIESMEVEHKWNQRSQLANGLLGSIGGGVGAGTLIGGPAGAVAGGIMGAAGIGQTLYNRAESQALYNDKIDAAKDQFNWNNQNIQARPYGLTKVSTLNQNNKFFPFIEFYDCTEEEKETIVEKIKYQGMTINKLGRIKDYINKNYEPYNMNYIQATLVRMEGIKEDQHFLNDINNELYGGIYINAD